MAFSLATGEKAEALTGVVVTVTAGRVEFRKAVDLETTRGPLHIEPGETLFLLTYLGEGFTKAWFKGDIYEDVDGAMAFFSDLCQREAAAPCAGRIVEQPQSVWWVQVRNVRGEIGWTREPEKFDGKDAFGKQNP